MSGVVLDAGAFIALERRSGTMVELTRRFVSARTPLVTSAGVVAQVWRGGSRQIGVAYLLHRVKVVDLTAHRRARGFLGARARLVGSHVRSARPARPGSEAPD